MRKGEKRIARRLKMNREDAKMLKANREEVKDANY